MKKHAIIAAGVAIFALPLCVISHTNEADMPFTSVQGVTSATSLSSAISSVTSSSSSATDDDDKKKKSSSGLSSILSGLTSSSSSKSSSSDDDTTTSSSTKSSGLSSILSGLTSSSSSSSTDVLTSVISSVIGLNKVTEENLIGTWKYDEPGVAFTSESTLASAGGEVVAETCKTKLSSSYSSLGFSSSNTYFTFKDDGTFSAKILGKSCSGKYTFDEDEQQITLSITLLKLTGYTKKNTDGIALLFESKKILTLLQAVASISGNTTLETISELSTNYDGVRIGFDLKK